MNFDRLLELVHRAHVQRAARAVQLSESRHRRRAGRARRARRTPGSPAFSSPIFRSAPIPSAKRGSATGRSRSSASSRRRRRSERMREIAAHGSGFVYLISRLGVTGVRDDLPADLPETVARLRSAATLPVCVGFGVSRPEQAARGRAHRRRRRRRQRDRARRGRERRQAAVALAASLRVGDRRGLTAPAPCRRSRFAACAFTRSSASSRTSARSPQPIEIDLDRARRRPATRSSTIASCTTLTAAALAAGPIDFLEEIADRVVQRRARATATRIQSARVAVRKPHVAHAGSARVCRGRRRARARMVDVAYIALGSNLGDRRRASRARARRRWRRFPETHRDRRIVHRGDRTARRDSAGRRISIR